MSQDQNMELQQKNKATQRAIEEYKQKIMPLVRYLRKHKLKFKQASFNGHAIEYFRMDMLKQLIEKNKEDIEKNPNISALIKNINDELVFFKRPANVQKLRFPGTLTPTDNNNVGKFACFKIDTTQSKKYYLPIILFVILAAVLFPLWPYALKYSLWLISLWIVIIAISVLVIRLILYTIFASFGVSFWLLPRLLGDYGIIQSFMPLYSVEKWQKNNFSIVMRLLCFGIFAYYCFSIYTEPEFYLQNFKSAKEVAEDVHDWGVSKIKGEAANFSQRAIGVESIINQTSDAFDQEEEEQLQAKFQIPKVDIPEAEF